MFTIVRCTQASEEMVEAWMRLMPQLNPSVPAPGLDALAEMLKNGATELFAAREESSKRLVGMLALVVFTTPTGTHAWIEDVVVDEPYRGQGIGEALTLAAIDRARLRGAKSVDLTSHPGRGAANRLYQRIGFILRNSNLYRFKL